MPAPCAVVGVNWPSVNAGQGGAPWCRARALFLVGLSVTVLSLPVSVRCDVMELPTADLPSLKHLSVPS